MLDASVSASTTCVRRMRASSPHRKVSSRCALAGDVGSLYCDRSWVAGADAVATVEQKANELLAQVDAYRDLSSSLAVKER